MTRRRRIAFVTIGQSPRTDMVPEICADLPPIEVVERGALDGLDDAAIADLAPADGAPSLATRLADGREVVIDKARTEERLDRLLRDMDDPSLDAVVVLCTGTRVPPLTKTLLIEAQAVVDGLAEALAAGVRHLGVVVPLERQIAHISLGETPGRRVTGTHASPYGEDRFEAAAADLAEADLIVMHCMGYDEAMRRRVADRVKAPVLLSRRIVAGGIRQIL